MKSFSAAAHPRAESWPWGGQVRARAGADARSESACLAPLARFVLWLCVVEVCGE